MEIIWTPDKDFLENSNVARFMRKHGISSYRELVKKSQEDIEWFWSEVEKWFNFHWMKPYEKVLDTSKGIMWAKWFAGGKINLTENCVDRHVKSWRRNKLALIWEGEDGDICRLTYRDLYREVNRLANSLKSIGVKRGDRVGIFMPMLPEAVIASFAVPKIGGLYVPIFSGFGPDAVASRLKDAGAKVLITCDGFLRRGKKIELKKIADEACEIAGCVENVLVKRRLGIDVKMKEGRDLFLDEIMMSSSEKLECEETDSEEPFFIGYTSGTTGKPKGVVHVHGGFLVKITEEVAFQVDMREEDILFWFTEMGWIMGPWETVGGCALGGTVFLYEGAPDWPSPDRLWKIIERHGISILGISPTLIRALMKYGEEPVLKHDLSSLRVLGSTGEPWNPEPYMWFFEKVGKRRCPIINLSGGTEVGACFLSPHPVATLKPCTLQGPALGMAIDVFDENGKPLRKGVGELVALKPWPGMTRGIWNDPERYIETYWSRWKDVWVHGDWASIDEDGFWFLHGRSDDTIKIAGKRIGPAEIESSLTSDPSVLESAAIGVPDEIKGEAIVCFVVLKPDVQPDEAIKERLTSLIENKLGKTARPKEIIFVKDLPKTRNAKVMRRLIRNKYLGKPIGDTSTLENSEAIDAIPTIK